MTPLDYPLWLSAIHFFDVLFLSLLIRSGVEIFSAHPQLYWNDHCTPGSEWLTVWQRHASGELRLRLGTQLGSTMVKYLPAIEFVEDYKTVGQGHWRMA